MTRHLLRALVCGAAIALLAPSFARAAPVFVGATARSPAGEGLAARVEDALGKALATEGVVDLSEAPKADVGPAGRVEDLERLLADARGRYLEGDFKGALAQTRDALRRFEEGFAYEANEAAWRAWTELMLVRALAEGRLGQENDVERTFAALAAARPDYVPDPGLAPPKVVSRYRAIQIAIQKARSEAPGALELVSRPAGAEILLDGRPAGLTPQTLRDLTPGPHYVALRLGGHTWRERVVLERGKKTLSATLDDPRRAPATTLKARLARGLSERDLVRLAADVDEEVLIALVEPAAAEVRVLVGRVQGGALVAVTALAVRDDLSDLEDAATLLASAAPEATRDGLAAGSGDVRSLRRRFLGAAIAAEDESDGAGLALLWSGAVGASILVIGAAAVTTALIFNQPPNPGGTDLVIDASNL